MNDLNLVRDLLKDRRYITRNYYFSVAGYMNGAARWSKLLTEIKSVGGDLALSTIRVASGRQVVIHAPADAEIVNEFVSGLSAMRAARRANDAYRYIKSAAALSVTSSAIAENMGITSSTAGNYLRELKAAGKIAMVGGSRWCEYCLSENTVAANRLIAKRRKKANKSKRKRKQTYVRKTVDIDYKARALADAAAITQLAKDAGEAITKKHVMESLGLFDARYRAAKALVKNVEFSRGSLGEVLITHYEASQANGGRSDKMARRNAGGTGEMIWKTPDQFDFTEAKSARLW